MGQPSTPTPPASPTTAPTSDSSALTLRAISPATSLDETVGVSLPCVRDEVNCMLGRVHGTSSITFPQICLVAQLLIPVPQNSAPSSRAIRSTRTPAARPHYVSDPQYGLHTAFDKSLQFHQWLALYQSRLLSRTLPRVCIHRATTSSRPSSPTP